MKISYISNIKLSESSGGMSGINHAVYHQLKRSFDVEEYIYINAKEDRWAKVKSKMLRVLGFKGNYPFFSNKRLNAINKLFQDRKESCDAYFFFGFTSWINIDVTKPYYCYNDASFATYVDIYNNKSEFSEKDLERIYQKEKKWLQNAQLVFFNSDWAIEETKKAYGLTGVNFINIGFGGFIEIPKHDKYKGDYNFLFISREFIPKGGQIVVSAIHKLRKSYPQANLYIVGDKPSQKILEIEGVVYKGFLRKSSVKECTSLKSIFSKSFCIVHPTLKDINPLVLVELSYFGCPAISSNRFAIPEFIKDKGTGLLLDNPRDVNEVVANMLWLIEHPKAYKDMRQTVRNNAIENYTWETLGERFKQLIRS